MSTEQLINQLGEGFSAEEIAKIAEIAAQVEQKAKNFPSQFMERRQGGEDYAIVATTRPETIMGDTALCINPNNPKTAHLKGKKVIVPPTEMAAYPTEISHISLEIHSISTEITSVSLEMYSVSLEMKHILSEITHVSLEMPSISIEIQYVSLEMASVSTETAPISLETHRSTHRKKEVSLYR